MKVTDNSVSWVMHKQTPGWALDWQEWEHVDIRGLFVENSTDRCTTAIRDPRKRISIFFYSHCYKQYPAAKTNIQLSWCIYRFSILFLMWRRWHLCSHLRSVLLVDTFESLQGETSSHADIPADTGAQGISRIPFNDKPWFKKGKRRTGLTMETSLTDWRRRGLMYSQELQDFLFSQLYAKWLLLSKHGRLLCNAAAHMSHAAAGTCCCLRSIVSLIPELLHSQSLSRESCWATKRLNQLESLFLKDGTEQLLCLELACNNFVYIDKMSTAVSGASFYVFFFQQCRRNMQMHNADELLLAWPGCETNSTVYVRGDAKKTWWSWFW